MTNEYHLQFSGPILPAWPNGSVAVYKISGDQIAERIVMDDDGTVKERHYWCGYIGMYETVEEAAAAIKTDRKVS